LAQAILAQVATLAIVVGTTAPIPQPRAPAQ